MSPGSPAGPGELSRLIKARAAELGFDLCGVAPAAPITDGSLEAWIARGDAAGMTYMTERVAERLDPGRVVRGARSVVALALSYHRPQDEGDPALARVARYARGRDYHLFVRQRVRKLRRRLLELCPGARVQPTVDTSPVMEKVCAQRAGLGWIGKNTCLVNRTLGSWTLLGELVTDVQLPPDRPENDHCGTCSACLDACPTGAFTAPRRLDARRCLAYATIEHRGPLPASVLPALGDRLFGCDSCQDACPWNRRARPACAAPLAPRPQMAALNRRQLEHIRAPEWAALTAGTPLGRLDLPRMWRNLEGMAPRDPEPAPRACRP